MTGDDDEVAFVDMANKMQRNPKLPTPPPSFPDILAHSYFALSDFVQIENFLTDLPMKPDVMRTKFFKNLETSETLKGPKASI